MACSLNMSLMAIMKNRPSAKERLTWWDKQVRHFFYFRFPVADNQQINSHTWSAILCAGGYTEAQHCSVIGVGCLIAYMFRFCTTWVGTGTGLPQFYCSDVHLCRGSRVEVPTQINVNPRKFYNIEYTVYSILVGPLTKSLDQNFGFPNSHAIQVSHKVTPIFNQYLRNTIFCICSHLIPVTKRKWFLWGFWFWLIRY